MRVLLLAFFIAFSFQASSQCDFRNSINADISLDSTTFSKLIENQYSRLINGDSKTKPGNFAGLDLKDGQMTFNASKIFKKMRVITLNATGSIDGSTYAIFNNSKINSNISLELKYSWLSQQNQRLRTTD